MCGIAGIVGGGRQADQGLIERMLQLLQHRGPDDQGIHFAQRAALGHRRLSIIDLEGGRQPIGNEDGSKWIVCNGEIYNYRELMRELEAKGHRFATRSDAEVILHLFEERGEGCLQLLRGMFAFAIWDERAQRLFAARDHLGQKPFFYCRAGKELAFASEIKALLHLLRGSPEIDPKALQQYLALRFTTPPRTMVAGVLKLPPAHWLSFDREGRLRVCRYWDLTYEPKLKGDEEDLLGALETELIEAVRLHMVSDVPLGAFLSGGLDSTLVTALAATHAAGGAIPTFSLGLPYRDHNEAPYARMVAQRYGTRHQELVMVPPLGKHLPDLIHYLDEPTDPLSICLFLISRLASQQVKVVLGGNGGNELFGGYDRYYGNVYANYYAILPEKVRRGLLEPLLRFVPDGGWYKSGGHKLKWLHRASLLSGGERYAQMYGYPYFLPERHADLFGPELRSTAQEFDPYAPIREAYEQAPAEHTIDKMLYADTQFRLPDHSCMNLDRTSMAHGLEARSPFMDHKLVEFAARLPVDMKVRWHTMRHAQRRLCAKYLPAPLLEREKQAFSSGLPYLLSEQYDHLSDCLLHQSWLARDGFLLQPGVDDLLQQQASGTTDHGHRLWLLLHAEAWYRQRICGQSRQALAEVIAGQSANSLPARRGRNAFGGRSRRSRGLGWKA